MDGVAVAESEEFEVCGKEKQAYSERECCLIQCLSTENRGIGACPLWKLSSLHRATADGLDGV